MQGLIFGLNTIGIVKLEGRIPGMQRDTTGRSIATQHLSTSHKVHTWDRMRSWKWKLCEDTMTEDSGISENLMQFIWHADYASGYFLFCSLNTNALAGSCSGRNHTYLLCSDLVVSGYPRNHWRLNNWMWITVSHALHQAFLGFLHGFMGV